MRRLSHGFAIRVARPEARSKRSLADPVETGTQWRCSQELSFACGDRVHFPCLSKENRTKRKDTPRSRPLRGFVNRSRGFRQFIPELAKTRVLPVRARFAAFSSPSHRCRRAQVQSDAGRFSLWLLPSRLSEKKLNPGRSPFPSAPSGAFPGSGC